MRLESWPIKVKGIQSILMDVDSLKRPIRTLETMGKQHEPTETLAPLTDQVCHILEQVCQQLETSR